MFPFRKRNERNPVQYIGLAKAGGTKASLKKTSAVHDVKVVGIPLLSRTKSVNWCI